jgi:hypothetical protein
VQLEEGRRVPESGLSRTAGRRLVVAPSSST